MTEAVIAVVAAIGSEVGGTIGATLIIYAPEIAAIVVAAATVAYAQSEQARARRNAKDNYNDSLRDRTITVRSTIQPSRVVLGRVRVGGALTFVGTTGPHKEQLAMIVALAGHEIDAVEQIYFDDTPVNLDGSGSVQTPPWFWSRRTTGVTTMAISGGGGSVVLPGTLVGGTVVVSTPGTESDPGGFSPQYPSTVAGNTVTVAGVDPALAFTANVNFEYLLTGSSAVITSHLGAPGQVVDPTLAALLPAEWDATHRGREVAYLMCYFSYDPDAYPAGLPNVSAVVRGAKVFDPRSSLTAWSENNALLMRHYALSPLGGRLSAGSVHTGDVIAAANVCDTSVVYTVAGVGTAGKLYTAGTMAKTDARPLDVLADLARSMAGSVAFTGNQLRLKAGAYVVPLLALGDDDFAGSSMQVQPRVPRDQLFNVVTGTFSDPANGWQVIDMPRVESTAYIAEDGAELPLEVQFSSVNRVGQTQQLAAVMLRQARQALTVVATFKLSAYAVELFDTISLTCTRYGWSNKSFEVLDRQWSIDGLIVLTLRETGPSIYTFGSAFDAVDAEPNTNLPNPFVVPAVTGLACASGTAQLLRQVDGTIVSRILVTWDAIVDEQVRTNGGVEIRWGRAGEPEIQWQSDTAAAGQSRMYLDNVQDRGLYFVKARAFNALVRGPWAGQVLHNVIGKTAVPFDVASFAATVVQSGVRFNWTLNVELDAADTELRLGATWTTATPIFQGKADTWTWLSPPLGTYTVLAKHHDTSGNVSAGATSATVVVDAAAALQWANIAGRPKLFRVVSRGYVDTAAPIGIGLYNGETNTALNTAGAPYQLAVISRTTGSVTSVTSYNPLGVGLSEANRLATDLNALGSGQIVVIWTNDEPQTSRLLGNLPAAMKRCGASAAVFGSPAFAYRAAYVLIAIAGCGEGNGFESYQGDAAFPNSTFCDVTFSLQAGNLIITGAGATPRTLADYAYTGSLDATSDLTLIARGVVLAGNSASKLSGAGAWDSDAYSRDSFTGGAYASVVPGTVPMDAMFGLNSDPTTDASYTSLDYAIYFEQASALVYAYESGTGYLLSGTYAASDVFAVLYDGNTVKYLRNGVVMRSVAAASGLKFFFDSSFASIGSSLRHIRFGPLTDISGALSAAAAAAAAAATAQGAANSALAELTDIASDSLLTPVEKPAVVRDYSVLITEQGGIDAQATNYAVTTEKSAYDTAVSDLTAYLSGLTSPTNWDNLGGNTTIVGSTFRAKFIAAYTTRQALLDKISANAKARLGALATLGSVGTGQIDTNAVTETVTYADAAGVVHCPAC